MTETSYRRMTPDARLYVAGHDGLVGSAIMRRLQVGGYSQVIARTFAELDLTRQAETEASTRATVRSR